MTAYQVYEQTVKPLSVAEKLTLTQLIINELAAKIPMPSEPDPPPIARKPREFGAGRHLLSGAGIDVDALMATPIEDMFADYMPEDE